MSSISNLGGRELLEIAVKKDLNLDLEKTSSKLLLLRL